MLGPSILMGRVAAKQIAEEIRHPLHGSEPKAKIEASLLAEAHSTDPETLRSWQEVLRQLVAKPRGGYFHFEKVHAVVLARNYDCARCHHETSPLALTEDQLDRKTLIQACPVCHGGVKE